MRNKNLLNILALKYTCISTIQRAEIQTQLKKLKSLNTHKS